MNFIVSGAFEIPRKENGHIDNAKAAKAKFWKTVSDEREGLQYASGCYVFALNTGGGPIPWYVGKAERQSFDSEVFALHKLHHYNDVLAGCKGTPYIFLIPRLSPKRKLCRPTKSSNSSIRLLETLLIGMALRRNPKLKNIKDTAILRQLRVRGVISSDAKGNPGSAASALKKTLGIQ
jgi:hypothetical protein